MWLADLAWPRAEEHAAAGAILAVPLGSTEQHGPHLPLSTDTDIVLALCERLAATRRDVLVAPPVPTTDRPLPAFFAAYGQWMATPPPTWADIAWPRAQWNGPFLLKGVIRVDEARRAVDAGVSTISVSTHGGNNLDGTPATIRALPAIANASATRSKSCSTAPPRPSSPVDRVLRSHR